MFEFIINDGQDSTSLNCRSLFPKIAYCASENVPHSYCSQKLEEPLVFKKNAENRFKPRGRFYKPKTGLKFTTIRLTRVSKQPR